MPLLKLRAHTKSHLALLLVGITLVVVGCTPRAKMVQTGKLYPPHSGLVQILPARPTNIEYEEIGTVSVSAKQHFQWAQLVEQMKKKAAEYGANAIIIKEAETTTPSTVVYSPSSGFVAGSHGMKELIGIAIRTLD